MSLVGIPKGNLEGIRRIGFKFIFLGSREKSVIPIASHKRLIVPNIFLGWDIKNIFFSKLLAAKSV